MILQFPTNINPFNYSTQVLYIQKYEKPGLHVFCILYWNSHKNLSLFLIDTGAIFRAVHFHPYQENATITTWYPNSALTTTLFLHMICWHGTGMAGWDNRKNVYRILEVLNQTHIWPCCWALPSVLCGAVKGYAYHVPLCSRMNNFEVDSTHMLNRIWNKSLLFR